MKYILVTVAALAAASCSAPVSTAPADATVAIETAETAPAQSAETHWTYDDQAQWSATCATGARQSPIELREQTLIDEPELKFSYSSGPAKLFNNGHAVEVTAPPGQTMTAGAETFTLLQAHFHDPSEHRLSGAAFPMEMHLVHRRADDGLAVIGVLFREGAENAALAPLWAAFPAEIGKEHGADVAFDASQFLPADRVHFEYEGSLTTPPCTEGVRWFVMHAPIEASAAQIAALVSRVGANARAVQAANDRPVTEGN